MGWGHIGSASQVSPPPNLPPNGGGISSAPFEPFITNFYMTDPISRASKTMAECTRVFLGLGPDEEYEEYEEYLDPDFKAPTPRDVKGPHVEP